MKNPARKHIQKMTPYICPIEERWSYDGYLLDFNEATAPISKAAQKALIDMVKQNKLQCYPEYNEFKKSLANYTKVPQNRILVTNGSEQAIEFIFRTFTETGSRVVIPYPAFPVFYQSAQEAGCDIIMPEYNPDFSFPLREMLKAIKPGVKLVVIANPNNPTGTAVSLKDIEEIIKKALKNSTLVFVDEAYYEFAGTTVIPLLKKYPNLIVTRSFSKAFGLASLRVGYMISSEELIAEMDKIRAPYNLNMAGVIAANASLKDLKSIKSYTKEVMEKSKPMVEDFFTENNIIFYPSAGNFILFKPDNAQAVFEKLKKNGIMVRPQKGKRLDGLIRMGIGTAAQMERFIRIYKRCFK